MRPSLLSFHGNASRAERDTWIPGTVDFAVNTNPWGPPPGLVHAIANAEVARYPDTEASTLTRSWEERLALGPGELVFGAGAIELIHAAVRAFLMPGGRLATLTPTFTEPERFALAAGGVVQRVPAFTPFAGSWDTAACTERILAMGAPDVVYLCSPNNPTGHGTTDQQLCDLLHGTQPQILILDESFHSASSTEPALDRLRARPIDGVLRVRSLTKDFSIPGVRLGYATGHPQIISAIREQMPPWSVSAGATAAGHGVLEADSLRFLGESTQLWRLAGDSTAAALEERGFAVSKGPAPFRLIAVGDAAAWRAALLSRGVAVRDCTSFGLPKIIRVCARPEPDRLRLLRAVDSILTSPPPRES